MGLVFVWVLVRPYSNAKFLRFGGLVGFSSSYFRCVVPKCLTISTHLVLTPGVRSMVG